ncbi:MAG: CrcB family protein [Schumannella sp.]
MTVVAVLIGGVLGTGLRLGVDALLPHEGTGFPWSTLLINVTGSFVLGFLVSRVWPAAPAWLRAGLGTGLLGSFTTFSALAASLVAISAGGAALTALAYLAASLVAGSAQRGWACASARRVPRSC